MIAKRLSLLLLLLPLACAGAFAQDAAAPAAAADGDSKVEVSAVRNPDLKKYRSMIAGLDEFEDRRADYAPRAPELRFKLTPRRTASGLESLANLSLRIVGETESIPVPVAADGTFSLPRNGRAYDEAADLIMNRKQGALRGFPEVRTPGLPANVRRLGDHRLECRVIVAIAKKEIGFFLTATINTLLLTTDWCSSSKGHWGLDADANLEGATIREGGRSEELPVHGRSYDVPMGDKSWTNEALIELRPLPPPTPEELATPFGRPMYVMGTMNSWSAGARLKKVEEGVYRAQLTLYKRKHEFKIGAVDFEGIDLGGATQGQLVPPGTPVTLGAKGRNLVLPVETEGKYTFTLDVRNEAAPQLTVTRD